MFKTMNTTCQFISIKHKNSTINRAMSYSRVINSKVMNIIFCPFGQYDYGNNPEVNFKRREFKFSLKK